MGSKIAPWLRTSILASTGLTLFMSDAWAAEGAAELEPIIVTARKREERLQNVPVAVTALSARTVAAAGIATIDDVKSMTPGFSVSTYNPVSPQPYIRGVGTNASSVGDDASVGLFIDEVYAGRAGGFRSTLYDVERIEVLRGPQGTLYGRNVAGGAINVVTRDPGDSLEGDVTVGYGRFDMFEAKGGVTIPVNDAISTRLALSWRTRDGYVTNIVNGHKLKGEESLNLRGKIRFKLTEDVDFLFGADYSNDDMTGPAARGSTGTDLPTDGDPKRVSLYQDGFADREIWGMNGKLNWDMGPGTLTTITAYRDQHYTDVDDLIGNFTETPIGGGVLFGLGLVNEAEENSDQFSEEIRFASNDEGPFNYTVGAYYFEEAITRFETYDSSPPAFPGLSRPTWDATNRTNSFALFGEATFDLSDQFSLTAGARQTWDKKRFSLRAANPDFFGFLLTPIDVRRSEAWSQLSPKASLNFKPSDALMLYASWSKGYKAGGFNGVAAFQDAARTPFSPEIATNYEAGVKSEFFDRRARLNLAVFRLDYKDLQNFFISDPDPVTGVGSIVVANANARSKGFEAELTLTPARGLSLFATWGYLDAKFRTFQFNDALVGNRLSRAPKNMVSAGIEYRHDTGLGEALARIDYSYQSKSYMTATNVEAAAAPAYSLVNAKLGLTLQNGVDLSVWGRNIFDEAYVVHAFPIGPFGFPVYGEPATWGVSAGIKF